MRGRVNADLLLVGSVPAQSTEEALRAGAAHFGDLVFALPDGETGPRSTWVGYERETLARPQRQRQGTLCSTWLTIPHGNGNL